MTRRDSYLSATDPASGGPVTASAALRRFSPANRRRLSAPGLRTFVAIADIWTLDEQERRLVLGLPPRSAYRRWIHSAEHQREIVLSVDVLLRISAVLGIHQSLSVLHGSGQEAFGWLRGGIKSMPFDGNTPLELVTSGTQDGLLTVRRYLEAAAGLSSGSGNVDLDFARYDDDDIIFTASWKVFPG